MRLRRTGRPAGNPPAGPRRDVGAGAAAGVPRQAGPLLRARALTKKYPGVVAVDSVDLDVHGGEVLALLGQNGAGKSTLIQVLSGVHAAGSYSGDLELEDQPYAPGSPADAEAAGIVLIPQQIGVIPDLTVAQNMFVNAEPTTRAGLVDWPALYATARTVLADFHLSVDPHARMGSLDLATQQLVVLARALSSRARVLVLDEPTAALTEGEASRLFGHLRDLRARGVAIVFVTHRLGEVFALADRIVVLRDGRVRGDHRTGATSRAEVITEMLGADLQAAEAQAVPHTPGAAALEVTGLVVHDPDDPDRLRVDGLDLTVRHGEIVGLFGLVGSGCTAAAMALFGAWPGRVTGTVRVDGRDVRVRTPADAIRAGIGLLAPDRRQTMIADQSVADNLVLASLGRLGRAGTVDPYAKQVLAQSYVERLGIRTPSVSTPVGSLSGGNQQKVQVARWLAAGTRVLVLVDPTHGVDVGARAEIYALLRQLSADGYALALVSSDAEELAAVCDHALVMRTGRLVGALAGSTLTEARLLHEAAGE